MSLSDDRKLVNKVRRIIEDEDNKRSTSQQVHAVIEAVENRQREIFAEEQFARRGDSFG